jgi:hypothetical protein
MHRIFLILTVSIAFLQCNSPRQESSSRNDTTAMKDTPPATRVTENALSADEQQQGWKLLFDGKSMQGWRVFRNLENNSWEVSDGTLHCKPFDENGENKRADLITENKYGNFELKFDWKITPQANTGVIFHVSEEMKESYETGPEFQIVDDVGYAGDPEKTQLTGALYHMYPAAAEKPLNAVGEWNESRIVINGNHVEHWLNGMKVVEYELKSEDWKKRIKASKWKDFPKYASTGTGHIALQDHKNEVWFRNLKIKTL